MSEATLRLSGALFCDPEELTAPQRVDELVALERQLASIHARQCRVLAAMIEDQHTASAAPQLDKEWVREDIRAALGESAFGANIRMVVAESLAHRFPATLAALSHGEVNFRQARVLCDETRVLDASAARAVETAALAAVRAPGRDATLSAFRRVVRRAVLAVDPHAAEQRHQRAVGDRRVGVSPDNDGMSALWGSLRAPDAVLFDTALDYLADQSAKYAAQHDPSDVRTRDQRRADALVAMARDALNGRCNHCDEHTGSASRPAPATHPSVQVTVALSTLLYLDDQPAELAGYGPIHAALARSIAADETSTWRRLVTDELGHLIDYGRTTYTPPADLDRHVRAHDTECIFPTCHRRAEACELDHTIDWALGGPTNAANLKPACLRHHHAKHDTRWSLRRLPGGTMEWTSPTGHIYTKRSTTYPVDGTAGLLAGDEPIADAEHPATQTDSDPPF